MGGTSPQLEDGYIRVANELYDAILSYPFTGRQLKVLLAIMRKTYGYGKKTDDASASQIGSLCGLNRTHVTTTLNQLSEIGAITKVAGAYGSVVGVNKDYKSWRPSSTKTGHKYHNGTSTSPVHGVPKKCFSSTESVQADSTKSVHTKDNLPKDNQQKTIACADAFARFWAAYPKKKSKGQAEKTFAKIKPSEQLLEAILAGIERAKTSEQWTTNEGKYIPHPSSWLNGRCWEDEDVNPLGSGWWESAGFANKFLAENEGCTEKTSHLWRDGVRRLETA